MTFLRIWRMAFTNAPTTDVLPVPAYPFSMKRQWSCGQVRNSDNLSMSPLCWLVGSNGNLSLIVLETYSLIKILFFYKRTRAAGTFQKNRKN